MAMKWKLSEDKLRSLVVRRLIKGTAFMLEDYGEAKARVAAQLDQMTPAEIMAKWPHLTYDIDPKGFYSRPEGFTKS